MFLEVDREMAMTQGVAIDSVYNTLQTFLGGTMVNYFNRFGLQWHRAWRDRVREPLHTALDRRSVNEVEPGGWTWFAVLLSMLVFTSGHAPHEWPAALAYGLLMALLWMHRRDLISCVTAHAVTNISLALFVLATGSWQYW